MFHSNHNPFDPSRIIETNAPVIRNVYITSAHTLPGRFTTGRLFRRSPNGHSTWLRFISENVDYCTLSNRFESLLAHNKIFGNITGMYQRGVSKPDFQLQHRGQPLKSFHIYVAPTFEICVPNLVCILV